MGYPDDGSWDRIGSPPRAIRARDRSWLGEVAHGLILLPHTCVGLGLILYVTAQLCALSLSSVAGGRVPGTVTKLTRTVSKKGGVTRRVQYAFTVDGAEKSYGEDIDEEGYAALKEGQAVTVRVHPLLPVGAQLLVDGVHPWRKLGFFSVMAVFWNSVMSVVLWQIWVGSLVRRRLLRIGERARGTVRAREVKTGKATTYWIHYSYDAPARSGVLNAPPERYPGSMAVPKESHDALETGAPLVVLYDPARPSWSVLADHAPHEIVPRGVS